MQGVSRVGRLATAAAFVLLFASTPARANPETASLYDARTLGLGGAIGPLVDGPTAAYHNPAGLGHVDRFELNVAFAPMVVELEAPFAGAGSEQSTGWVFAPPAFVGGAFRVHERLTLGFSVYMLTAFGGLFDDVARIGDCSLQLDQQVTCGDVSPPADQNVVFVVAETAIPITVNVLENLRIGVSLRLPYGVQSVDASSQNPLGGGYFRSKQEVSGFGVPGILFGVQWDAHEQLSLSFAYRSKVRVHMEGEVDLDGLLPGLGSAPTSTNWRVPHMFRAGVAWRPLEDRLRVVAEGRLQLHEEANESQTFVVNAFGGTMSQVVPFDWRNVWVVTGGAEYQITERWPVRLGFSWANSATPRSTVTPFQTPPDVSPGFYAGSGFHAPTWSLDAGLGYSGGAETHIESPGANCRDPLLASPAGCDGTYRVQTVFAGLSFEYTLGGQDYVLGGEPAPQWADAAAPAPRAPAP